MTLLHDAQPGVTATDGRWHAGPAVVHWRFGTIGASDDASALGRRWLEDLVRSADLFPWRGLRSAGPWRKPLLVGAPEADASISHSGRFLLAAVTVGAAIGVDIEAAPFTAFDSPALQRRMCSPAELERAAALEPDDRRRWLASVWTAKEAVTKASGHGMATDFRTLSADAALPDAEADAAAHLALLDHGTPVVVRLIIEHSATPVDAELAPLSA
ncbi:MAG: 4'-phosphopantetheinyl transferase superfamily protein [Jiangellaceae bacterium]